MKNKKKILSLLACLSLLTSCNKSTPSSSSCKTTTSTPSVEPTPTPTPEKLNIFDYANTSTITSTDDLLLTGTIQLNSFNNQLTDEMKLTVEEITIPEEINGIKLTKLYNPTGGLFKGFDNLKRIKISKNIAFIYSSSVNDLSSPFMNLPSLESIEVDSNNEWYYTKGNCLIEKGWNKSNGNRTLNGSYNIVCGWKNVEIPEEITTIRNYAFYNSNVTKITLNSNVKSIGESSFRSIDSLIDIDTNNNQNFIIKGTNILFEKSTNGILTAWGDAIFPSDISGIYQGSGVYALAFSYTNITSIDLSNCRQISSNDYGVFAQCKKLTRIILDSKLVTNGLNTYAFKYIDNLKSISFNGENSNFKLKDNYDDNNNLIGQMLYDKDEKNIYAAWGNVIISADLIDTFTTTFSNFNSITSIKLPKTIDLTNNIKTSVYYFTNLKNLKSVTFEEGSKYITNGYFIIDSETNAIVNSFGYSDFNSQIFNIPEGIEIINVNFIGFENVSEINFPSSLKRIDIKCTNYYSGGIFSYKNNITELNIPKSVEYISKDSFANLNNIEKVNIEEGNQHLINEKGMLINKDNDEIALGYGDVDLSDRTEIDNKNFNNYKCIKSFRFSKNLTSFPLTNGFANLNGLKTIYFDGTEEEFKNCASGNLYSRFLRSYPKVTVVFEDNTSKLITDIK